MADNNASGLVNRIDASDHGAAVILPSSHLQAVDYFNKLNGDYARQAQLEKAVNSNKIADADARIMSKSANLLYPYQKVFMDLHDQWRSTAGADMYEKDPNKRLMLNQQRSLIEQKMAQVVGVNNETKERIKIEDAAVARGQKYGDDHTNYRNKFMSTYVTDVTDPKQLFIPGQVKAANNFFENAGKLQIGKGNYNVEGKPDANGASTTMTQDGIDKKTFDNLVATYIETSEDAAAFLDGTPEKQKQLEDQTRNIVAARLGANIYEPKKDVRNNEYYPIGAGITRERGFAPKDNNNSSAGDYKGKGSFNAAITKEGDWNTFTQDYKDNKNSEFFVTIPTTTKDDKGALLQFGYKNPQVKVNRKTGEIRVYGDKYKYVPSRAGDAPHYEDMGMKAEVVVRDKKYLAELFNYGGNTVGLDDDNNFTIDPDNTNIKNVTDPYGLAKTRSASRPSDKGIYKAGSKTAESAATQKGNTFKARAEKKNKDK